MADGEPLPCVTAGEIGTDRDEEDGDVEKEEVTPQLSGVWTVYRQENFEEFLRTLGAPWVIRKTFGSYKPTSEIIQNGNEFEIKFVSKLINRVEKFQVGEEYELVEMFGHAFKVKPSWDGDKLVQEYTCKEGKQKSRKTIRSIVNDELHIVQQVDDVISYRYCKRSE